MDGLDSTQDPRAHPLVIAGQLSDLRSITEQGFAKLDGRIERVEEKTDALDRRVTRVEVKQDSAERNGIDLTKILIAVFALLAAALGGHAAPL